MNFTPFSIRQRIGLPLFILLTVAAFGAESIDSVQKSAADWAKIRSETVRLETEWKLRRELMGSTITALQERFKFLETNKDALMAKTAGDRKTLTDLAAKQEEAAKSMDAVGEKLGQINQRLIQLLPSLPPRLAQALELPYRSLADTSISAGERTQLMVRILNRCAQFNKTITFAEEVMNPENEATPRMMEVLYWGLSHGYALDRSTGKAYLGQPSAKGWAWDPAAGETEHISRLIAVYKDQADPDFVETSARVSAFPAEVTP